MTAMTRDFLRKMAQVDRRCEMLRWSRLLQKDASFLVEWTGRSAAELDRMLVGEVKWYSTEVK